MLDPADRTVLTEALRAPVGFRLDHIVATTYTLDLIALLTLPLSFTLSSGDGITESGSVDPIALLEALRRHTGRITVFCQAGCIGAPRRGQLLFGYLESSVIEAKAHRERGVFHPKVAVIRYTADTRHSGPHAEEHPDPTAIRYGGRWRVSASQMARRTGGMGATAAILPACVEALAWVG